MSSGAGTAGGVVAFCGIVAVLVSAQAQTGVYERSFPQSKAAIEHALKKMQPNLSGHLPVLEGFAKAGDRPLDRYARGFYQTTVRVTANASGGSQVRVTAKVTAWYTDPVASGSGYQLLVSNGRLETDLLDQLADELSAGTKSSSNSASLPAAAENGAQPTISAPSPAFPDTRRTFSSSLSQALASTENADDRTSEQKKADKALQAEADALGLALKNQIHPTNLVAVKKSGTPVVATASLSAKPEFLASMHDEFELLDYNADWVHVRISGLSRGWIWRTSVEMPDGIADTDAPTGSALTPSVDLFHVVRDETAQFPGSWEPLRSKSVEILSVQKIDNKAASTGPVERLDYAKFLLNKTYRELSKKPGGLAGIVVIFDSADGGMMAATLDTLQQWQAGTLPDSALWHKCFFDPPEAFDSAAASRGQ